MTPRERIAAARAVINAEEPPCLADWVEYTDALCDDLEAALEALEKYAQHAAPCAEHTCLPHRCTCGLTAARKRLGLS